LGLFFIASPEAQIKLQMGGLYEAYLSEATDVLEQNGSSPEGLSSSRRVKDWNSLVKTSMKEEKKTR
jgi:hypothetical protein